MNRFLSQSSRLVLTRSTRGLVGSALRNGNFPPSSMAKASGVYISRRYNSSEAGKDAAEKAVENFPSGFDVSNVADSAVIDAATAIAVEAPAKAGFVVDHIMSGIDLLHTFAGIPYWEAIVLTTIGVRICLLPVALKTVQGAARMACVRPDLKKIQDKMKADPNSGDMQAQMRYQQEMKAIMKKHDVNPFRAMLWPFAQFPIFIAFFWALQDMGTFYPGFATGGALWFTNLAAPDALLILPVLNSLSFWAMIELGSDGVQMEQASTFKNVMRGLAVVMVPLTMNMPQGLFVYWCTNNVLSLIQTFVLKNEKVKQALKIPNAPAPEDTPNFKQVNPLQALSEALTRDRELKSNAKAEILDGIVAPPGPPVTPAATNVATSFAMPPRQSRRPKTTTASVLDVEKKKKKQ